MSNYRRPTVAGGTYFITQVTDRRESWLCREVGRKAPREAIAKVREKYPFSIEAFVLLPDHFHYLWILPEVNADFSTRLRLIKTFVTKHYGSQLAIALTVRIVCYTHVFAAEKSKRSRCNQVDWMGNGL